MDFYFRRVGPSAPPSPAPPATELFLFAVKEEEKEETHEELLAHFNFPHLLFPLQV